MSDTVPCRFKFPDFAGDPAGAREIVYAALALMPIGTIQNMIAGLMVLAVTVHPSEEVDRVPLAPAESLVLSVFTECLGDASRELAAKRAKLPGLRELQ